MHPSRDARKRTVSAMGYGHADDIARQLQNADNGAAHPWYMCPDARKALAERDIGAVYRLLYRDGVSQREIARRTGQSQSEVSEIMYGGRQVRDITVLARHHGAGAHRRWARGAPAVPASPGGRLWRRWPGWRLRWRGHGCRPPRGGERGDAAQARAGAGWGRRVRPPGQGTRRAPRWRPVPAATRRSSAGWLGRWPQPGRDPGYADVSSCGYRRRLAASSRSVPAWRRCAAATGRPARAALQPR